MLIQRHGDTVKLFLNAEDTRLWAVRRGQGWPCSFLSGKTLFAEFYKGDVIDCTINSEYSYVDMPLDEFNAITRDFLTAVGKTDVWRLGAGPYVDHTILRNDVEVGYIHHPSIYVVYWYEDCALKSKRATTYEECMDIVKTALET